MRTATCSNPQGSCPHRVGGVCLTRREALQVCGAGAVSLLLGQLFPGRVFAQDAERSATLLTYPRKRIAGIAELVQDKPVSFLYPGDEEMYSGCTLYKLGRRAGGGVGPEQDIVAFSAYCAHMGAAMHGQYNAEHKVAGPCPQHLTTYDLTRHGLVVSGHATQSLPQIVLELDGDDLFAVGILGLIYGVSSNHALVNQTTG